MTKSRLKSICSRIKAESAVKNVAAGIKKLPKLCVEIYKNYPIRDVSKRLRKNLKPTKIKRRCLKFLKKPLRFISDSWKVVLMSLSCFLFCYYVIGGFISEKISTEDMPENTPKTTSQIMADLIDREVRDNIWTPNLPIIFPAYILDNMPNFQIGVIYAIRDTASALKQIYYQTPEQKQHIQKASVLLKYSPNVWLLSRKSAFSIAPSSNSQYRKARRELIRAGEYGPLISTAANFDVLLSQMSSQLTKLIEENENNIAEKSSDWFDFKSDDLFYKNKGYAYAQWQIADSVGNEFKELIVAAEAYNHWTYLINSLRKAAQMNPIIVRNGKIDSSLAPNHLTVQNYFLSRAVVNIEKIRNSIWKKYANQN